MKSIFYGWSGRFIRSLVAILISGFAVQYGDSSFYMLVGPVLMSISKALRDTYGWDIKIL